MIIAILHMTLGLNPGAPHRLRPRETFSGCVWGVQGHLAVAAQSGSKQNLRGGAWD